MAIRCRKNQSTLTAAEKSAFVAAVLALKASGRYDTYTSDHLGAHFDAHQGPAFLPWHREFLRRFELDLQSIDPSVTLPYWDWTIDNSPTSTIWDPSFLGGNGRPSDGWVTTGPFAHSTGNWTLIYDGPALRRRFGLSPQAPTLSTPADLTWALNDSIYDVAPWDRFTVSGFRNKLEGWINGPLLHNRAHVWVGGSMLPMSSPNDPVFFLHHCFIDKLWADWQRKYPASGYLPVSGALSGHNLGDAMQPWLGRGYTVTPASVLNHHALGYAYDNEGLCLPTFKFADDFPTLKFRDDLPTLKFRDDWPTLKFRDDLPTLKYFDDPPPTLKIFDDPPPTLKFRDDPPTLKALDDQPTLKIADDQTTLKFGDDQPTLKAVDDQPTLKFGDDQPTLKAADDQPTLKFGDDQSTVKFGDDQQTLKFADDGGGGSTPNKAVDDVKLPALDDPTIVKSQQDVLDPRFARPGAAPFVLSTPHHSMAWTQDQPGVLEAAASQLEAEITQLESVISERQKFQQQGQLTVEEIQELERLQADYQAVMAEYQQLLGSAGR